MSYTLWLIPTLFAALAIGAHALVARAIGAGRPQQAVHALQQALLIGCLWAVIVTGVFGWGGLHFVRWMQLDGLAGEASDRYLTIIVWAIPAIMVEHIGIAALRAAGDTRSGLLIMSMVNLVNLVLSAGLVSGIGFFPHLGWEGLAAGTLAGHCVGAVLTAAMLVSGRAGLWLPLRPVPFRPAIVRRLLRVGIPGGVDNLTLIGCQLWFLAIINSLGAIDAAAHTLGIRIESLAYLPGGAFQVASATMAGQFLGAGQPDRATRSALMALGLGTLLMTAIGAIFFFGAGPLVTFFVSRENMELVDKTVPLLRIVACVMPALAINMILAGTFRGAGDTRWPLLFTLVGLVGIRIPLAYALALETIQLPWQPLPVGGWGLGVIGAWYAMAADLTVRALLTAIRFVHGGWLRVRV